MLFVVEEYLNRPNPASRVTVLIVGATSGIAQALAHAYAADGRSLVLAGRSLEPLDAMATALRDTYAVAVETRRCDILERNAAPRLLATLPEMPSTVVMAVGTMSGGTRAIMQVNYVGPVLFLADLAERMRRGTIIGISSVAGDRPRASNLAYSSAKEGFSAYLADLHYLLAPRGVHVMTVKPGPVRTRMTQGMRLPWLLTAQPAEVARAVLRGEARRCRVVYVRRIWRPLSWVVRHIPEVVFRRLAL